MPASFYRPLFLIWLRINYAIFGTSARGWHLASILMHVLATALVFALAMMLLRDRKVALIAAMIFGLHPVHSESVAWLSASTDVLATVLVLASIYYFLCSQESALVVGIDCALRDSASGQRSGHCRPCC